MYLQEQQTEVLVINKQCKTCYNYYDLSNFNLAQGRNNKHYYRNICNKCRNIKTAERSLRNKGTLNTWLVNALCGSRKRAKEKGLEHNLTREWVLSNLPKTCPVLGIPLSFTGDKNSTPSLDRFDNNKGYTTDNVRVISYRANVLKNNATLEELEAIVRYMKNES